MQQSTLPKEIKYAYLFMALNTASFQIALGSPLILFAREIGASASVLGFITGLTPLLSTLQMPMASVARRIGYRNLMFRGWGGRVLTLVWLTAMPIIAQWASRELTVALLVACMLTFNFVRGLGAGTWLPLMSALVPRTLRGDYLSRERLYSAIASVTALGVSGIILARNDTNGQHSLIAYAVLFGLSFIVGAISLHFLRLVPDLTGAGKEMHTTENTPAALEVLRWRDLFKDNNFRRFALFGVLMQILIASSNTFSIVFAREEIGLQDGSLVLLSAGASIASMIGLFYIRPRLDSMGSKPFMRAILVCWVVYYVLWLLMALKIITFGVLLVPMILVANGFFISVFEAPSTRLLMNMFGDRAGGPQFFTLYGVLISLAAGFAPMIWGAILDLLRSGAFSRYSYFFAAEIVLLGVVALLLRRVNESS